MSDGLLDKAPLVQMSRFSCVLDCESYFKTKYGCRGGGHKFVLGRAMASSCIIALAHATAHGVSNAVRVDTGDWDV